MLGNPGKCDIICHDRLADVQHNATNVHLSVYRYFIATLSSLISLLIFLPRSFSFRTSSTVQLLHTYDLNRIFNRSFSLSFLFQLEVLVPLLRTLHLAKNNLQLAGSAQVAMPLPYDPTRDDVAGVPLDMVGSSTSLLGELDKH